MNISAVTPQIASHAPRTLYIEDRLRAEIALAKEHGERREFEHNDRIFSVDADTIVRDVRLQYWKTLRCDGHVPDLGLPNVRPVRAMRHLRIAA